MEIVPYNRNSAVSYALSWALRRNPQYYDFSDLGGDCTSFISQCVFAGSGIMNFTPIFGWYYFSSFDRSPSWSGVEFFYDFMGGLCSIHKSKTLKKIPKNLPLFLIAGDDDPVGEYGKSVKKLYDTYQKFDLADVTLKLYPEARHELFNEYNKADVMNDFLVWVLSKIEE